MGVLLALGVSEWSEKRNISEQTDNALENIAIEIRSNQELLKKIHANNIATLEAMANDEADGEDRNFIPGLQLRETAWETFMSTGLSNHANYDKVLVLSQTYETQDIYKQTGRQMVEATMMMSAYAAAMASEIDNSQYQEKFIAYFQMLAAIETQLLKSYEETIANLNANN